MCRRYFVCKNSVGTRFFFEISVVHAVQCLRPESRHDGKKQKIKKKPNNFFFGNPEDTPPTVVTPVDGLISNYLSGHFECLFFEDLNCLTLQTRTVTGDLVHGARGIYTKSSANLSSPSRERRSLEPNANRSWAEFISPPHIARVPTGKNSKDTAYSGSFVTPRKEKNDYLAFLKIQVHRTDFVSYRYKLYVVRRPCKHCWSKIHTYLFKYWYQKF